jgi:hypothetical protein
MRDLAPDQSYREKLHESLSGWAAAHNVLGQVTACSVGFPADYDDEPPLDPVPMHESPAGELWRLLDADAAARAGHAPDDSDEADGIRYAGARLRYLLDGQVRTSGWPQPDDAAEALGELARLAELASALAGQADKVLGRELRAGRVTPSSSARTGRAAAPADAAARIHDSAAAAISGLGEAATQLGRMQMRAGDLQRTIRAAVAGTSDGPALRRQYLVRCSPLGWTACYHVRVFDPAGQRPLVIIGELGDSHSPHLNNAIETVAALVSEHLLGTGDPDAVTWAQYGPAEEWYSRHDEDDDTTVRGDSQDEAFVIDFAPGFATTGHSWKTGHDELQRLAGGPVRRWHVYDYTIAAVTADGAQPVTLPPGQRQRTRA